MATQSYLQYLQPITLGSGEKHFQTLDEIAQIALGRGFSQSKTGKVVNLIQNGASDDVLRKNGVASEYIPHLRAYTSYYTNPQEFAKNELNYLKENLLTKPDKFGSVDVNLSDLKDEELSTILDTYSKLQSLPEIQKIIGNKTPVGQNGITGDPSLMFSKDMSVSNLTPYDFPTTQRAIDSILADRAGIASATAEADRFLDTAPDELATARAGFFSGQRKRATDYLANEFLPTTIEDLGVSGRPMSFAGDIIASKAGELETTIAQHQAEQESSDAALFADMAYQKTFQDLIDTRSDVSAKVNYERANLKQTQAQGFQSRQSDIQRKFDLSLFEKENADALKAYQTKINTASTKAKSASEANTFAALGKTAAQVGGTVIASKIPGVIG